MYAVIRTGGSQARVQEGDVIDVERVRGDQVDFQALLIVGDDGTVVSDKDALAKATVTGKVMGERRGKKVEVFHFRNKSGYRKTQGHRQTYTQVEITKIAAPGLKAPAKKAPAKKAPAKKAPAKKPAAKKPAAAKSTTTAKKEPAAKKETAAKSTAKKSTSTTKKTTSTAKKTTAKKTTTKKSPAKKDE